MNPSRHWQEVIGVDEPERHARLAHEVRHWHEVKNQRWGQGRFLHRKPVLGASATLAVHDDLPEAARNGIFARPGSLPAVVRLSNGAPDVQANTKPDIRGFAIRVLGVSGPAALGGEGDHQDFLLINHDMFDAADSAEFMEVATALVRGGELGVVMFLLRKYGFADGVARIRRTISTLARPFAGYNAEHFTSAAPLAIGPYAAKVRITPIAPRARTHKDNALDVTDQLAAGPIAYEMALQFYTNDGATPIESPRQAWSTEASPPVPVATLTLDAIADSEVVERMAFDPWGGLAAHRPLGEIMRARRAAYRASQQARAV